MAVDHVAVVVGRRVPNPMERNAVCRRARGPADPQSPFGVSGQFPASLPSGVRNTYPVSCQTNILPFPDGAGSAAGWTVDQTALVAARVRALCPAPGKSVKYVVPMLRLIAIATPQTPSAAMTTKGLQFSAGQNMARTIPSGNCRNVVDTRPTMLCPANLDAGVHGDACQFAGNVADRQSESQRPAN